MKPVSTHEIGTPVLPPASDPAIPAVQFAAVGKSYGLLQRKIALRNVSLRVDRGECYGLAGPNGAGKTTLIRIMLGLIAPDDGEVRLFGIRPDSPDVRRRVGFVPEAAELPTGASPLQLVKRWARLRELPVKAAVERGEATLRRCSSVQRIASPRERSNEHCWPWRCSVSPSSSCSTSRPTASIHLAARWCAS
jgi:ABC-type Na+ transport system ATPase subunit NatA